MKTTTNWLQKADLNDPENHPLVIAAIFHQKFLNEIHPFSDGNGRIARIFMNLILLKNGFPPIFINEVGKSDYLNRFELSETDFNFMLDFICDCMIESLKTKIEFNS